MPTKYYSIRLSEDAEIQVFFQTAQGLIVNFVVKLIYRVGEKYYEVVRFDSAHGCPHKDVLDSDGSVRRKIWFKLLGNKQGLDLAIRDLRDNSISRGTRNG
jgi:hypothetical protein